MDIDATSFFTRNSDEERLLQRIRSGEVKKAVVISNNYRLDLSVEPLSESVFPVTKLRSSSGHSLVAKVGVSDAELNLLTDKTSFRDADSHLLKSVFHDKAVPFAQYSSSVAIYERTGGSLSRIMKNRIFASTEALTMYVFPALLNVFEAVDFLHGQYRIHGNLTADHVLLEQSDSCRFKLGGLSNAVPFQSPHPMTRVSADHLAPELALYATHPQGAVPKAHASMDVYALAILLLKLFLPNTTTLVEFINLSEEEITHRVAEFARGQGDAATFFKSSLDASKLRTPEKAIVIKCLHPDPAKRGNMHELKRILPVRNTTQLADLNTVIANQEAMKRTAVQLNTITVPALWTLEEVNKNPECFFATVERLCKLKFKVKFICEMHGSHHACEYYDSKDIIVEAKSELAKRLLPLLRFTSLLVKVLVQLASWGGLAGALFSPDEGFSDNINCTVDAIQGVNDMIENLGIQDTLENILSDERDTVPEDELRQYEEQVTAVFDKARENAEMYQQLFEVLEMAKFTPQHIYGGLVKKVLSSGPNNGEVRFVCKAHAENQQHLFVRSVVDNPTLYHEHKPLLKPVLTYPMSWPNVEDVSPAPQPQPSSAPFDPIIATLVDLTKHLKSFPATKTWPLMGSFDLKNRPLTTDNHPIFECVDEEQKTLGLVVKLTDERRELEFCNEVWASQLLQWLSADTFLVRCVKWGEVTIESRKCFALVLLLGEANCLSLLGWFQVTSVGRPNRYTCLKKVVAAVKFLHDNGYVHGDIKLENVMKFSGLLDFKLSHFDNTVRIGSPFDDHCSPEYCPPEMARRMQPNHGLQPLIAHPSFDVWCVGVLVLKLFVPMGLLVEFYGLTGQEIIDKIATTGFTFEASLARVEGLDPAQVQVLKTCLAVDPTHRATLDSILGLVPPAFITRTPGASNVPSSPVTSSAFSDEKEGREDLKDTMEVAKAFRQEDLFARLAQDETMRDQLEDESFVYMVKSLQANPSQFDRRNEGMNRVFQYLQRFSESIVRGPAPQPPVLLAQDPCQLPVMWTIRLLTDKAILSIEEQIRGLKCRIGVVNTPSAECSYDELHFVTVSAESEVVALVLPFVRASRVLLDVLDFITAYNVDISWLNFVVPHADTIEATVNALETIHQATTALPSETLLRELDTRLIDGDVTKQEVEDICNRVERVVMELGTSFDTIERVTEILDTIAGLQSDKTLAIVGGLVRSGDRSWKCHGHVTAA